MKRHSLITIVASLLAASSASAYEELMSPFDISEAEANLSAGFTPTGSQYNFTPSKTGTVFEGESLGLSFVDQNAAFGPEISLIKRGERETSGFRLGVGYDISGSTAPSIDGRRDTAVPSLQHLNGNPNASSGFASDDSDPLSINLGFHLNF